MVSMAPKAFPGLREPSVLQVQQVRLVRQGLKAFKVQWVLRVLLGPQGPRVLKVTQGELVRLDFRALAVSKEPSVSKVSVVQRAKRAQLGASVYRGSRVQQVRMGFKVSLVRKVQQGLKVFKDRSVRSVQPVLRVPKGP
jgi:hypothetical protein